MSNQHMNREEREHLRHLRDAHAENQNWVCSSCSCTMTPVQKKPTPTMVTVDHIKPIAKGGGSNYLNTTAVCYNCNKKKGSKTDRNRMLRVVKTFTYAYICQTEPNILNLINLPEADQYTALKRIVERDRTDVIIKHKNRLMEDRQPS